MGTEDRESGERRSEDGASVSTILKVEEFACCTSGAFPSSAVCGLSVDLPDENKDQRFVHMRDSHLSPIVHCHYTCQRIVEYVW